MKVWAYVFKLAYLVESLTQNGGNSETSIEKEICMSGPSNAAVLAAEEAYPLQSVPGSGLQTPRNNGAPKVAYWDYKKLAISSIICGISCIGICALINSVKAQERSLRDPVNAQRYAQKARRLSIIAIVIWVCLLMLIPPLLILASYLITFIN
ncbi:hypothetical protein GJAV_G00214040 [Gymnothorax javanicus]|nr:hypothetical protein GJAV_G00214040 [Gymnothorax javanicus]